ncbi:MAG: MOSC domain-containing protein [Planctomycetes bacterium]|nr:MOSC domain-containing protein [Planctomycetota bacterium]
MNLTAEVVSIHIVRKRKLTQELCNSVSVRANFGIEGDYRSGRYQDGQITLVEAEAMDEASRRLGYAISGGASRRQIMVRGVSLNQLVGYRLRLGYIVVEGEALCRPCNNMEKRIGVGAKEAMNGRGGIRCRVIRGGSLRVGDRVTIEDSFWTFYGKLLRLPRKCIFFTLRMFQG